MIPKAEPEGITELLENIPEEIQQRAQWVVHKEKVPYIAGGVGRASSTDSLTWRTFDEAVQARQASPGRYDGIGFVFSSGDPYAGVDLDNCRNPETGELEEWAAKIVEDFGGYAEVSQSGTGVHIIVRGKAPNKRRGNVEAYSSERYFAMTGRVL
jgi:putative DNA primase/helicase